MRRSRISSGAASSCFLAALMFLTWALPPAVLGQEKFSGQMAGADQELNRAYQQAIQRLPRAAQTRLRAVERAWVVFNQLNRNAMRAAAARLAVPGDELESLEAEQLRMRSSELSMVATRESQPDALARLKRADEELNAAYQRCLGELTPAEISKLREAQKAWMAFRHASRPFGLELCLRITGHRTDQLHDFYIRSGETPSQASARPLSPTAREKPDSTVPDPFERAR